MFLSEWSLSCLLVTDIQIQMHMHHSWDLFIMVFVIFCAIEVPLEISYGVPNTDNIIDILNWAFAVDIRLCFRTAYVDEQGYLVGNVWGGEAVPSLT